MKLDMKLRLIEWLDKYHEEDIHHKAANESKTCSCGKKKDIGEPECESHKDYINIINNN